MLVRSRRQFMGACAAALAALGIRPKNSLAQEVLGSQADDAMVGDSFYLARPTPTDPGTVPLPACNTVGSATELDQFCLLLRGKRGVRHSEGISAVTNWDGHPNFNLHVQPTHIDKRNRERYIANFAQLR